MDWHNVAISFLAEINVLVSLGNVKQLEEIEKFCVGVFELLCNVRGEQVFAFQKIHITGSEVLDYDEKLTRLM